VGPQTGLDALEKIPYLVGIRMPISCSSFSLVTTRRNALNKKTKVISEDEYGKGKIKIIKAKS